MLLPLPVLSGLVAPYQERASALIVAFAAMRDDDVARARELTCAFVDALQADGVTPERTIVILKRVLALANWPRAREGVDRDHERVRLISGCIDRYFAERGDAKTEKGQAGKGGCTAHGAQAE